MEQCSMCKTQFPIVTLKQLIHIINGKAYIEKLCPVCQVIAENNNTYYYIGDKEVK